MSAKSYIVKKINELPTFTGALSPDDLVAFYDISTGITHKIKVSDIGGGSLDHRDLTQESRNAVGAHPNLELALATETVNREQNDNLIRQDLTTETQNRTSGDETLALAITTETQIRSSNDANLQQQIFAIQENNSVASNVVFDALANKVNISDQTAANVIVDATGFNGNLAPTDTNAQSCFQKFDDLVLATPKTEAFTQTLTFNSYFKYYPKTTQSADINFVAGAKTLPNAKINVELELNSLFETRIEGVNLIDVVAVPHVTTNFAITRNDYNGLSGLYDAIFYRIGASDLIRCEIMKIAQTEAAAPKIISYTFASDNSYVIINSNQPLYGNNTASLPIQSNDFAIANTDLRGGLSSIAIASIVKTNDSPLIGGETALKVNLTLSGTANGDEIFEIKPVLDSVYSNFGVAMPVNETTGVLLVNFDSVTPIINALSIVDSLQIAAITNFVNTLRTNFVWRDIFTLYPFYGTTAASQKWNWKNPSDTDAARRLTFVNDNVSYHTDSGYKGAGVGYINTHILSSDFGSNDVCFAYHAYEALDITFGSQNGTSYLCHSKNGTVNYIGYDSNLPNITKDYTNTNIINLREFDNISYFFRGNQLMIKGAFIKGAKNVLELFLSSINNSGAAWLTRNVGISFWMTGINLTTTKNYIFNSSLKTMFATIKPDVTFSPDYSNAVLFQGDSISTDYNIPANTGWTTLLANNKAWYKVSAALSGRTLNNSQNNSLYRLKDLDIPKYTAEYLYSIIALGINDSIITTSVQVQTFIDQYNLTIDDYVAKGWDLNDLTLLTPYYKKLPDARLLSFVQAVKDIGTSRSIRVIDIYTHMLNNGGDTLIQADGIHPTEAGHTVIYNYVRTFY